jgi:hypothetical protein
MKKSYKELQVSDNGAMMYTATLKEIFSWAEYILDGNTCADMWIEIRYKDGGTYSNMGGDLVFGEYKGKRGIECAIYGDADCYLVYGPVVLVGGAIDGEEEVWQPRDYAEAEHEGEYSFEPVAAAEYGLV